MFDKLGDLLNETLEEGEVRFTKAGTEAVTEEEKTTSAEDLHSREEEAPADSPRTKAFYTKNINAEEKVRKDEKPVIYKYIPPEIERAFRVLGIGINAEAEEIKKAYKEKIKYYHPDRHGNNAVMYKVSTDKTREVVEAYNLIAGFLKIR